MKRMNEKKLMETFHCSKVSDKVREMRGGIVHGQLVRR